MAVKYRWESAKRKRHIPRQHKALLFRWRSLIVLLWVLFQSGTLYIIFRGALHDWPWAFPFLIWGCFWPSIPSVWFICYSCLFTNTCLFSPVGFYLLLSRCCMKGCSTEQASSLHFVSFQHTWMYVDRHAGKAWWLISLSQLRNRDDNSLGKVWQ